MQVEVGVDPHGGVVTVRWRREPESRDLLQNDSRGKVRVIMKPFMKQVSLSVLNKGDIVLVALPVHPEAEVHGLGVAEDWFNVCLLSRNSGERSPAGCGWRCAWSASSPLTELSVWAASEVGEVLVPRLVELTLGSELGLSLLT